MSLSRLDAAFRWHSGGSVTAELRRARLDGAHAELVETDLARGDAVEQVAAHWGFSPSELVRVYAEEYGDFPFR